MAKGDEEKIAFFTREGVFCYKRLPFGLKNARATYQRLVDTVFNNQIGRNLEVHVDDMVIKSDSEEDMLADIQETFDKLRAINMKLNPRKCSFGVEEGPFLGYLITKQGIKANPSKVKAISDLKLPKMEAEEAFQKMKEYIETLPTVTTPIKGETLILARPKKSERIAKLVIDLGEYDIEFKGRNSIKGQILADFLAEIPTTECKEKETQDARNEELDPKDTWKLYIDGASSSDGFEAGLILINHEGREYTYALRFEFETTINEANKPSERTLRSETTSYKAILGENKRDTQKLQELLHGTCPVRSEQESKCLKQASFYDLLKARKGSLGGSIT
ncbi:reverse transcriptase domain-containing protein [Tanacetum coccineum]|uniref:Reverse transcriptase domain-containing protein n=1 Tax=Tanacetum coccineum TaxID=301880 RepID=A0ABQ5GQX5_9ASTR